MDQAAQIKQAVAEAMAAHSVFLGLSAETLAIVFATFAGPVFAILVSMALTSMAERKRRRVHVFRTLLATRRTAITQDHVTGINLIEVEFFKVPSVMAAWRKYMDHLSSGPTDRQMTVQEHIDSEDKRTDLLARLLEKIGKKVGFKMSEIDLKRGGYAPGGWQSRDYAEYQMRSAVTSVFEGRTAIRVLSEQVSPESPHPSN